MNKNIKKQAVNILKNGGIVIIPTETVYGIAADARNKFAVEKIYSLKNRGLNKPLQVLCKNIEQVEEFVELNAKAKKLAEKFLPGPLSMVLNCKFPEIANNVNSKDGSIAIRIPDSEIIRDIINDFGFPLACTSANLSGNDAANSIDTIDEEILKSADLLIDGGKCRVGFASTVADLRGLEPIILRQGKIKLSDLDI